jgi:hypothetical protein
VAKVAKAITAAAVMFGAMYDALSPGGITADEWVRLAVSIIVATAGVWLIPNGPPPPEKKEH